MYCGRAGAMLGCRVHLCKSRAAPGGRRPGDFLAIELWKRVRFRHGRAGSRGNSAGRARHTKTPDSRRVAGGTTETAIRKRSLTLCQPRGPVNQRDRLRSLEADLFCWPGGGTWKKWNTSRPRHSGAPGSASFRVPGPGGPCSASKSRWTRSKGRRGPVERWGRGSEWPCTSWAAERTAPAGTAGAGAQLVRTRRSYRARQEAGGRLQVVAHQGPGLIGVRNLPVGASSEGPRRQPAFSAQTHPDNPKGSRGPRAESTRRASSGNAASRAGTLG